MEVRRADAPSACRRLLKRRGIEGALDACAAAAGVGPVHFDLLRAAAGGMAANREPLLVELHYLALAERGTAAVEQRRRVGLHLGAPASARHNHQVDSEPHGGSPVPVAVTSNVCDPLWSCCCEKVPLSWSWNESVA